MSEFVANIKRDDAKLYCSNIDFDPYTGGGTYVPVEAVMIMEEKIDEPDVKFIWDQRGEDLPEIETYDIMICNSYSDITRSTSGNIVVPNGTQ
eukprot:15329742-Ditylum_brightwellii.AAC.1